MKLLVKMDIINYSYFAGLYVWDQEKSLSGKKLNKLIFKEHNFIFDKNHFVDLIFVFMIGFDISFLKKN